MKKNKFLIGSTLTLTLIVTLFSQATVFADTNQGKMISGRTMIPLRGAFTDLGFEVSWDGANNVATLKDEKHIIKVKKDDVNFSVDGNIYQSDVAPTLVNGSIYIPLRSIGEKIGAVTDWDSALQIASMSYNNDTAYITLGSVGTISKSSNSSEAELVKGYIDSELEIITDFNKGLDSVNYSTDNTYAINNLEAARFYSNKLGKTDFSNVSPSIKANITSFIENVDKSAEAYILAINAYDSENYEEANKRLDIAVKHSLVANLYHNALVDFYNAY